MTDLTRTAIVPRDLVALRFVGDPQPSPDGRRIAFVVTTVDADENTYRSRIWAVPTDGSTPPAPLSAGEKNDTSPRWSPDGSQVAFVSTRDGDTPQIFVLDRRGGEARQVTRGKEGAASPVWSPDGTRIAFVRHVGGEKEPDADADEQVKQAWNERVRVVTTIQYRQDGDGYRDGGYDHLFVVSADGGEPTQITDGAWDDSEPAWSPDGTTIAFVSYREANRDLVVRADLWIVPATGGNARKLTGSNGETTAPAWSPDGVQIAYFGHQEAANWSPTTRLWVAAANGSASPRCLTAALDRHTAIGTLHDQTLPDTPNAPRWSADGQMLHMLVADGGNVHGYRVAVTGGKPEREQGGERVILAARSLPDGGTVLLATTADAPAELFVVGGAHGAIERQLTRINAEFLAAKEVRVPERFTVRGSDDHAIDCWLLTPPGFDPSRTYPLVLEIHGGPQAQYGNAFMHELQTWAGAGYLVVYTNPHGSIGYGEHFTAALRRRYGEQDMPDVMAAVETVVARGIVDAGRIGATGGSYGGFLVNWLIGHTDRIAAAITQRCVSNWVSDFGSSDLSAIGAVVEFDGPPWEQMETYMRLSPITYAGNVRTPLLIEHQDEDYRCRLEQAEQMYMALRLRGVPVELVRYPGESHGMSRGGKPQHRTDRLERHLTWFSRWMNGDIPAL